MNKKRVCVYIAILIFLVVGVIFIKNINNNKNNENDNNNERVAFAQREVNKIYDSLGFILIVNSIDNNNKINEYIIDKNYDFLSNIENRQLFVMEQILKNNDSSKFIVLNGSDQSETSDLKPSDDGTIAYYPYDLFNNVYLNYFENVFNVSESKNSELNNKYDNSSDFVYYQNKRIGANGLSVVSMDVNSVTKTGETYKASLTISYTDRQAQSLGYKSSKGSLSYKIINNKMILESFMLVA